MPMSIFSLSDDPVCLSAPGRQSCSSPTGSTGRSARVDKHLVRSRGGSRPTLAAWRASAAALGLLCLANPALANSLDSQFSFQIVEVEPDGEEQLVARKSVKPGETIHYEIRHENQSEDAMSGLVIAAPVPAGVTITFGTQSSNVPATFEVQAEMDPELDGLEWAQLPAVRKVRQPDGTLAEEPLPEAEVAAVRWSFSEPLAAGESALNTYRVKVN